LGVSTILEGSVRRAGNRIRITAQLIDARSDRHLWAKTYERELNDVFAIQSEIAETTAGALRLELLGSERESIKKKPTSDFEAFNLFLKGIHAAHQPGIFEGVTESIKFFEAAIAKDPTFGAPYSYLANMYISLAGVTLARDEAFPRAKSLTHTALELDPNSSDAHTALGNLALQSEQDWEAAEVEFRKAIALNPSNEMAHWWYAVLVGILQRPDEVIRELETILEIDPLWDQPKFGLAGAHAMKGDYPTAFAIVQAVVEGQSPSPLHHVALGLLYFGSGRLEEARGEAELAEGPLPLGRGMGRAILWALLGRPEEARSLLSEKLNLAKSKYVSQSDVAELFAALGDAASALEWLERDYATGERFLAFHYQSSAFDSMRESPQFQSMLKRLRLPTEPPNRSTKSR
jgi:adenylate cyclase